MQIISVAFVTGSSSFISGKRRPTSFEPWCVIDNFPETPQNYPYRVINRGNGRRLFYRECQGSCHFFEHNPQNEAGYGGAVFTGVLEDGSTFSVKGPWSSSCETVNALGLPSSPCAHVAIRKPSEPYSWRARFVTLPILQKIAEIVRLNWNLIVPISALTISKTKHEESWSFCASDEQLRAIRGRVMHSNTPYFVPVREFEDCATCEGKSYILGDTCWRCRGQGTYNGFSCFNCHGRGRISKSCSVCGNRGCASGIAPYPFMRGF